MSNLKVIITNFNKFNSTPKTNEFCKNSLFKDKSDAQNVYNHTTGLIEFLDIENITYKVIDEDENFSNNIIEEEHYYPEDSIGPKALEELTNKALLIRKIKTSQRFWNKKTEKQKQKLLNDFFNTKDLNFNIDNITQVKILEIWKSKLSPKGLELYYPNTQQIIEKACDEVIEDCKKTCKQFKSFEPEWFANYISQYSEENHQDMIEMLLNQLKIVLPLKNIVISIIKIDKI